MRKWMRKKAAKKELERTQVREEEERLEKEDGKKKKR